MRGEREGEEGGNAEGDWRCAKGGRAEGRMRKGGKEKGERVVDKNISVI